MVKIVLIFAFVNMAVSGMPTNGSPALDFLKEMGFANNPTTPKTKDSTNSLASWVSKTQKDLVPLLREVTDTYVKWREHHPGMRHVSSLWEFIAPETQFMVSRPAEYVFFNTKMTYRQAKNFCLEQHGILPELHTYK